MDLLGELGQLRHERLNCTSGVGNALLLLIHPGDAVMDEKPPARLSLLLQCMVRSFCNGKIGAEANASAMKFNELSSHRTSENKQKATR